MTPQTIQYPHRPRLSPFFLQNCLEAFLVALGTKGMLRFGRAGTFFQSVSENAAPNLSQLVLLLLSFPCFKVSHFLFKFVYTLQQRRLRIVGRKCARLGGQDLSLKFDNLRVDGRDIMEIYERLRKFKSSLEGCDGSGNLP